MSSFFPFRYAALLSIVSLQCMLPAQPEPSEPADALSYREAITQQDPMGFLEMGSRMAGILRDYYEASFGGRENWEKVESFRFEGVLRMPQGSLSFVAFKKKPDYCKIVLFAGNGARIVMSYDGADAWQLNTTESAEPRAMPPVEALNFIRDAPTAGHLLYPTLPGKQVELIGRRVVDGRSCYDLQVTLPDGQQVTYAIGCSDFVEHQQIAVNAVTGATEVTTHGEIKKIAGVSIPMQSTMTVDGQFVHEVQMRSVEVNRGLMPWMFARPSSSAYVPGRLPKRVEGGEVALSLDSLNAAAPGVGARNPSEATFGLNEPSASVFDASRFPALDAETKRSILDDIDDL